MPLVFSNSAITLCKSRSSVIDRPAASNQLPAWYAALMKSNLPHWLLAIPASMSMTFCEYPVLFIICDKALAELNGSCRKILHGRINLCNTRSTMYIDVYCFQIMWTRMHLYKETKSCSKDYLRNYVINNSNYLHRLLPQDHSKA